jgi:hypothetical protein
MHKKIIKLFLCASLLLGVPSFAKDFTFTAIGDQPYGSHEPFQQLIKKINQQKDNQFTIHVGDIKDGGSECSDQTFMNVKKMFDGFDKPLIYTPGDNEWTDCHRKSNGSYEPTERLKQVREIFFRSPKKKTSTTIKIESQSELFKDYSLYVENQRWTHNNILFVTIHQVGSNNNLDPKVPGAIVEYEARNKANLQWLENSFKLASQNQSDAIVLAMQSDSFHPLVGKSSGFSDFIAKLSILAQEFKKPVLLIQGDSHEYLVDQPLKKLNSPSGQNVIRLVVPGAKLIEAVEVKVNSNRFDAIGFFSFKKYSLN